ncbi:hypothetical protein ATCVCanal1_858L [Acanthocystis turfacea Chlorella virus Canal-1]|nr:hypothetical protein ATCVCanal1_858L [Acanthocystis turfacea Chlorella virus Canal-1]
MSRVEDGEYYRVSVRHEGNQRKILVGRALASTFLGKPPTLQHTADHKDKNSLNDTLENIRWLCKPGQRKNQTRPTDYKSAFIIVKDGVEFTAKGWTDVFKKPNGDKYSKKTIREYAKQQKHGFKYKDFSDIPGEEWKVVPKTKNKMGEWFISNTNRMKYKSPYAENVISVDQLCKDKGYPVVGINGKTTRCHDLSMMIFRPEEYATKRLDFIILHENDDRLDFRPSKLRWGTPPENTTDAHKNGKFDGKKKARRPVASYIDGEFEREHESLGDAVRYLKENGYSDASAKIISNVVENNNARYDRTWKNIVK